MHTPADRTRKKKSQAQTLLSGSKQKKNNLTRPAEEVTGQGEKKQKKFLHAQQLLTGQHKKKSVRADKKRLDRKSGARQRKKRAADRPATGQKRPGCCVPQQDVTG
jgi:hypothetical protein